MEHLFAPFKLIDQKIQAAVDAVAFFFMRRGVRRSFLMYVLFTIVILACVGGVWCFFLKHQFVNALINIACVVFMLKAQKVTFQYNKLSEDRGMVNSVPLQGFGVLKCIFVICLVMNIVSFLSPKISSDLPQNLFGIIFEVTYLLILYLINTPNTPPAQKQDVKITLDKPVHQSV